MEDFRPKILSVDDDEDFGLLLSFVFKKRADIELAHTINDGKAKLNSGYYHGVVLDYDLPDGFGADLGRWIVRTGARTKLAMISAHAFSDDEKESIQSVLGLSYFLKKPLSREMATDFAHQFVETLIGSERVFRENYEAIEHRLDHMLQSGSGKSQLEQVVEQAARSFDAQGERGEAKILRLLDDKMKRANERDPYLLCSLGDILSRYKGNLHLEEELPLRGEGLIWVIGENPKFWTTFFKAHLKGGFHVVVESNCERARELLKNREFKPDLVVATAENYSWVKDCKRKVALFVEGLGRVEGVDPGTVVIRGSMREGELQALLSPML